MHQAEPRGSVQRRRHREEFAPRLRRREAAEYLLEVWGVQIAPNTLAKKAVEGTGPEFTKWGKWPYYELDGLDKYARERLGRPRCSTSEEVDRC
jgi:hypothetical protein